MEIICSNSKYDYTLKVSLVGKAKIGKSFFVKRLLSYKDEKNFDFNKFKLDKAYIHTIAIDYFPLELIPLLYFMMSFSPKYKNGKMEQKIFFIIQNIEVKWYLSKAKLIAF